MSSEILGIRESNNEDLEKAGIITDNDYVKLFCLDVKYPDGIRENLYFGWSGFDTYVPHFEGWTLERFDMFLMARIEQFAWRYRELLLNGTDIKEVIKKDKENILKISSQISGRQFTKKII